MKINGFVSVATPDVVVKDGVIHVVNSVLIPPREPHNYQELGYQEDGNDPVRTLPFFGNGEEEKPEMSVEDLIARLEPYVEK